MSLLKDDILSEAIHVAILKVYSRTLVLWMSL